MTSMPDGSTTNHGLIADADGVGADSRQDLECCDDDIASRLRRDVEQLASFDRRTGTSGERRSAEWIARRLSDEIGADDITITRFRTQSSWAPAQLAYFLAAMVAAAISSLVGRLFGAAITVWYWLPTTMPHTTEWSGIRAQSHSTECGRDAPGKPCPLTSPL